MIVISDASPIITLCKGHCLDILEIFYGEVIITEKVYKEATNKKYLEQKKYIDSCNFIKKVNLTEEEKKKAVKMHNKHNNFHKGEASVIVLCLRDIDNSLLLVDDRKAIKIADSLGIKFIGTDTLLKKSSQANVITKERYSEIINSLLAKKQISEKKYHEMKKLVSQNKQESENKNSQTTYEKVEKEYSDYINEKYREKIESINNKHNNNPQPSKKQETLNTSFIVKAPEKH